jgi:hypothetical protein
MPEVHPMAWVKTGDSPAMLFVENSAAFFVGQLALRSLTAPPYGVIAYGAGNRLSAILPAVRDIGVTIETIDYLGDLDWEGLQIARRGAFTCDQLSLPPLKAAPKLHHAMLDSAERFGAPSGWPVTTHDPTPPPNADMLLAWLPKEVRECVRSILTGGNRVPEEALGLSEFATALV